MSTSIRQRVLDAIASVDDPELPGVSIVDLGLLEHVDVDESSGRVVVGLVPTFSGCPALGAIRSDVGRAVNDVDGAVEVSVEFLDTPVWTIDRITADGRRHLGDRLGVAVAVDPIVRCPRCDAPTRQQSLFGPTRCRAVHRCTGCGEPVEVMR